MRNAWVLGVGILLSSETGANEPTFCRDIAPIMYKYCVGCHRPGQVAPFSLLTYREVKKRASLIRQTVARRIMPPWKPREGYGNFAEPRRLNQPQIDLILRWIDSGCPEGSARDLPRAPQFPGGWQLGRPDLVLKMDRPFKVPAEGRDVYVHFVMPLELPPGYYLKGIDCRPSNPRVAHHAVAIFDQTGTARRLNQAAGGHGYQNSGGPGFVPLSIFPIYVPGRTPRFFPPRASMYVPPGTDFVLEMHYHSLGKEEVDQTEIGIYLTKHPPTRRMLGVMLSTAEIDIPAGEPRYVVSDHFELPVDLWADSVWPHMHFIGKEVKAWAELPDGWVERLLWIDDWDFNQQETYHFRQPIRLPKGTIVRAEWRYDNSEHNPRNPARPPRRVRHGEGSTDEMAVLWLSGEVASETDRQRLIQANIDHAFGLIQRATEFKKNR